MIPTPPLRVRDRLAALALAALADPAAREALARLAADPRAVEAWLGADDARHAALDQRRARAATTALATLPGPLRPTARADALAAAAAFFDAGLGFEAHEVLEPHWRAAEGEAREVLQGLIQIAVGFQHRANGNLAGARALLAEGLARIAGRALEGLALEPFARAVAAHLAALPADDRADGRTPDGGAGEAPTPPPFPRPAGARAAGDAPAG